MKAINEYVLRSKKPSSIDEYVLRSKKLSLVNEYVSKDTISSIDEYVSNDTILSIDEYVSKDTISSIDEYLLSKSNPKVANNVSSTIEKGIGHDECYNGTSFWNGCLKSTRSDLEKMLWKASRGYDKVQWIWFCKIDNIPFTIYDYREPKYDKDTEIEYHIGTAEKEETIEIVDKLKDLGFNAYKL